MLKTSKLPRALKETDLESQLLINKKAGHADASNQVIRMNSTYLEIVDGQYAYRGIMGVFGIFSLAAGIWLFFVMVLSDISQYRDIYWDHHDEAAMLLCLILPIIFIAGILAFNREIGEWFCYTHYPIRFNFKNRMIYVFRDKKTILTLPWDQVPFVLKTSGGRITSYYISGLVLEDSKTIKDEFIIGHAFAVENFWEFIRLYMEEGPQAIINAPGFKYCLPIADKRETVFQGWLALTSEFATSPILKIIFTPFFALSFIGRFVYRWTSKVPVWPKDIEDQCQINQNDPYIRDSSTNPEGYR